MDQVIHEPVQGNGTIGDSRDGAAPDEIRAGGDANKLSIDTIRVGATAIDLKIEQVDDGAAAILDEVEGVGGKPTIPVV